MREGDCGKEGDELKYGEKRTGREKKRARLAFALALAMTLSLFTSGLVQPSASAAVDENGREVFCGKKAHQHTDACYTTVRTLICGEEEVGHHHTDECYTEVEKLVCGQSECPPHHHTDECWSDVSTLICGETERPAHHHSDECYTERSVLICTNEDPEHVHTEECYTVEKVLNCGKEETEGHAHTDACYRVDRVLSCGKEETEGHTHTAECYQTERVLSCGREENDGHIHSEACWKEERVLSCGMQEHTHTWECYSDRSAVETEADWRASVSGAMISGRWDMDLVAVARTQIGYCESSRNFIVRNGVQRGYTRYGDWFDDSEAIVYGNWCASFVAFCMYYARIRNVPSSANCAVWVEKLIDAGMYYDYGEIEPRPGDLMFLYSGKEADAEAHKATHMGIVAEVREGGIVTIEGNVGPVSWREYEYDKTNQILGFGRLPENPDYITIPGDRGRISFSGTLPKDAVIKIVPIPAEELAKYDLPEGRVFFAFEAKVFVDGEPVRTRVAVNVKVEAPGVPQEGLQVIHVRENDQGGIVEKWPVELLTVSGDTVSYYEFSLARIIAVAPEP